MVIDDDGEEDSIALDNRNDSAVKFGIATKVTKKFLVSPIDPALIAVCAEKCFKRTSIIYQEYVKDVISQVFREFSDRVHTFIEHIIGSFLFNVNPDTGKKFTIADIKTARFIAGAFNIFTHTHSSDINILTARDMLNEILENSQSYQKMSGNTMKTALRNSVFMYFVLLISKYS